MGVIYKITCIENNKMYVGQTIRPLEKRWNQHLQQKTSSAISRAIFKYDKSSFKIEKIRECSNCMLNRWERFYIKKYNTLAPNGYNLQSGGDAKYEIAEETRRKLSKAFSGKNNHMYGRKHTEGTKSKISSKTKGSNSVHWGKKGELHHSYGIKLSQEHKDKIQKSTTGNKKSKEERKQASFNVTKEKHPMWSKKRPERTTLVECVTDGIKFNSTQEAADYYNTHNANISSVTSGRRKSYKGKVFVRIGKKKDPFKKKKVYCVELNTVYSSVTEAAQKLAINRNTLYGHLKNRSRTVSGMTFKYCEVNNGTD